MVKTISRRVSLIRGDFCFNTTGTHPKKRKQNSRKAYALREFNYIAIPASLAERQGFEPRVPFSTAVFKTAVIDHSTTSPFVKQDGPEKTVQKYEIYIYRTNYRQFFSHIQTRKTNIFILISHKNTSNNHTRTNAREATKR